MIVKGKDQVIVKGKASLFFYLNNYTYTYRSLVAAGSRSHRERDDSRTGRKRNHTTTGTGSRARLCRSATMAKNIGDAVGKQS